MVTQPLLSTRLATLSLAVSALLFATTANTAVIGQTKINSKQYEPLSASIDVSDIDPDSFSVSVANDLLYQQMGLNPDVPINVSFEKTSESTGKLILTSSQPVSEPFADVVLVVNDKGHAQSLPKTLLLPINKNKAVNTNQTVVGASPKPELPTVTPVEQPNQPSNIVASNTDTSNTVTLPNTTIDMTTDNNVVATDTSNETGIISTPSFPSQQEFLKADNTNSESQTGSVTSTTNPTPSATVETEQQPEVLAQSNANKQTDILSTQITRRYKSLDGDIKAVEILTGSELLEQQASTTTPNTGLETDDSDEILNATNTETPSDDTDGELTASSKPKADIPLGNATYKVQRNDNLWTIAQQISSKNNIDVYTVMEQIQAYNPDAFINGDKSQLLANVELALPDYEVIPSRLGMQAAIKARNSQSSKSRSSSKNVTAKTKRKTSSKATRQTAKATRPSTKKTASKPRLTLVTPTKQGQATGTARKGSTNNSNASLVASLEAARKNAAAQAKLVSGINETLAERTRRLQLHNQKLAELEKRLKELRKGK